eukprot:9151016-Pyramimonas_sp.AAC.1
MSSPTQGLENLPVCIVSATRISGNIRNISLAISGIRTSYHDCHHYYYNYDYYCYYYYYCDSYYYYNSNNKNYYYYYYCFCNSFNDVYY